MQRHEERRYDYAVLAYAVLALSNATQGILITLVLVVLAVVIAVVIGLGSRRSAPAVLQ